MLGLTRERLLAAYASAVDAVTAAVDTATPYAVTAFQWGFMPLIILLGMRSEPRLKFTDLLSPM